MTAGTLYMYSSGVLLGSRIFVSDRSCRSNETIDTIAAELFTSKHVSNE